MRKLKTPHEELQAAQEHDLRQVTGGHKDPPRADKHDTQGLLREYMAHMHEVLHHQECAYFVLLNLLDELIHDKEDKGVIIPDGRSRKHPPDHQAEGFGAEGSGS